jgi:hypothetical protein
LNPKLRPFRPAHLAQCASDQEAIVEAKKMLDGLDIEISDGARRDPA